METDQLTVLRKTFSYLTALDQIPGQQGLSDMLRAIVRTIMSALPVRTCSIWLRGDTSSTVRLTNAPLLVTESDPPDNADLEARAEARLRLAIDGLSLPRSSDDPLGNEPASAADAGDDLANNYILYPLLARDETAMGLVYMETSQPSFSPEDMLIFTVLANHVALSLHNYFLARRAQEKKEPGTRQAHPFGLLSAGTLLAERYEIVKPVGQGGMGAIYLAQDRHLSERMCAVKEMLDFFYDGEQRELAVNSFEREASMLAGLRHPGIPEIFDHFTEENRHYLVMEYIDGISLEQKLLGMGKPIPEVQVLEWAIQASEILQYLHASDPPIVYRDMKPANLLLTNDGRIVLVDFGIARFFARNRGTVVGTRGYSPPEQYRGEVEPRTDLFALAATMHFLLTERDPENEAPFSFPPVRSLNPQISEATERLITGALDPDPEQRPPTARAMKKALREILRLVLAQRYAADVFEAEPQELIEATGQSGASSQ